jgi:uncharacterized protein YkwD
MKKNPRFQAATLLLLLSLSACGMSSPAITKPGTTTPPTTTLNAFNQNMLNQVNAARATARNCGGTNYLAAPALTWNAKLEAASRVHNQDMLDHDFFDHTGSDGSQPWDRAKKQGYTFRAFGENIAWGQPTTKAVMDDWLSSPGHCSNIMSSGYTEIGVAALYPASSPNSPLWTMDLAHP